MALNHLQRRVVHISWLLGKPPQGDMGNVRGPKSRVLARIPGAKGEANVPREKRHGEPGPRHDET
ncbi:hypothetical protein ACX80R_15930 [Paeniglutamicibacter antarcticus]|uniref:Uncharacterized protein n=1 Tax=Paeniglutamicibacter antarcticus TaxID=494023 RepID=A0ABP9THK4_9MICC